MSTKKCTSCNKFRILSRFKKGSDLCRSCTGVFYGSVKATAAHCKACASACYSNPYFSACSDCIVKAKILTTERIALIHGKKVA